MFNKTKIQKVKEHIAAEVISGHLMVGMRLPSCRKLAAKLNVNKITVNKAYTELEREHKVYSISRGGFYLVDNANNTHINTKTIDFSSVKPDNRLVPYREFTHVINKAVDLYKNNIFGYQSSAGLSELQEELKQLFASDGIYTTAEQILITNGAQQALSLILSNIFHNSRKKLLVEIPTYSLVLHLAKFFGINVCGIERTQTGYDLTTFKHLLSQGDIGAFYVIPRHHNPTGYSLTENSKRIVVKLAEQYNVTLIEDDYLADIGDKRNSLPLHYYDNTKQSIYIRSFSKTFMPGIRIGAIVLPKAILSALSDLKYLIDLNTSPIMQASLAMFLHSGMYTKHISKIRKAYSRKLKIAKEIFQSLNPLNLSWYIPEQGIFIWLRIPEATNIPSMMDALRNQGIIIKQANDCFLDKDNRIADYSRYFRLCLSSIQEEDLNSLAKIIKNIANNQ